MSIIRCSVEFNPNAMAMTFLTKSPNIAHIRAIGMRQCECVVASVGIASGLSRRVYKFE